MSVHVLRTYIVVSDGMKTKPRTKPGHKWEWLEEQIHKTSELFDDTVHVRNAFMYSNYYCFLCALHQTVETMLQIL